MAYDRFVPCGARRAPLLLWLCDLVLGSVFVLLGYIFFRKLQRKITVIRRTRVYALLYICVVNARIEYYIYIYLVFTRTTA